MTLLVWCIIKNMSQNNQPFRKFPEIDRIKCSQYLNIIDIEKPVSKMINIDNCNKLMASSQNRV